MDIKNTKESDGFKVSNGCWQVFKVLHRSAGNVWMVSKELNRQPKPEDLHQKP
jgi:hypothetical protein